MAEKSKRFQIPRFYKTLLALTVVIGPITWLMATEDGRRRSDLMILGFQDKPMVEMRLDTLASTATEDKIREFLPQVTWQCDNIRTPFGERNCVTPIGAFNDAPAHYMVMYYEGNALQAMKVVYRSGYHNYLTTHLGQMLGSPQPADGVLQWKTVHGLVVIQKTLGQQDDEPSLIWLSAERVLRNSPEQPAPTT